MPEKEKREAALQPAVFNNPQMESAQELQGAAVAAADSYYITKEVLLSYLKEAEVRSQEVNPWIDYKNQKNRNLTGPTDVFYEVQEILQLCYLKMVQQLADDKSQDITRSNKSVNTPVEDVHDAANTPARGEDISVAEKEDPSPNGDVGNKDSR